MTPWPTAQTSGGEIRRRDDGSIASVQGMMNYQVAHPLKSRNNPSLSSVLMFHSLLSDPERSKLNPVSGGRGREGDHAAG